MALLHDVPRAVHYPAARLDRLRRSAAENEFSSAVAVDGIHEVVHDHVIQAGGDRLVLRFGEHAQQEIAGVGG